MGGMASAAAEDVKIGLGRMEPTEGFRQRTAARNRFEADQAASYGGDNNPRPRQAAIAPMTAPAVNYGMASVAAAPSVPNPDAIGETEQALLDAQKAGRSSTIQTSAKGLLSGEDDTRKRRSLMGGLIT
tara:strand:+ start:297 stop:683 length:387 start_codon:yes stop_codon:yes gene_type:complete